MRARILRDVPDAPEPAFEPVTIALDVSSYSELKSLYGLANWTPTASLFADRGASLREACREAGYQLASPDARATKWLRQHISETLEQAGESLDDE